MGKEFDLAVSLTVIDKGFKKSAGDGLFAIKQETTNAVTRAREILAPKAASFEQFYEAVNGHLHWLDDKLSVEHHLRRYSAWLKARNTPVELINQSQLDRDVWSVVEPRVLKLEDGQALFWLAMRTADAANGVALQQIKKDNGKLIQNSQLLPFDKLAEIEDFLGLLSSGREEASIAVSQDSGLSAVGGWIVEGDSIDFDKNLPALIDQTIQPNLIPAMMTERVFQLRSLPVIQSTEPAPVTVELSVEQPIEPEKSVPVTTADSFWFGAAAVSAVAVMPNVVERSVPVFSAKDITSQEPTKIIPLGLDAVEPRVKQETGVVPTRRVLVGQKIVKPIGQKTEKRVERGIEIQTTQPKPKLSAEQTVVFKVTPTRIISVGPEQIET
ncbi:MAG: hypothetical protein Q8P47_00085, partial [Candidatus Beckwithbacteria bacterium]|nr:hypothetical protein [Candidatus Beckwithbacteria bacterium]